jgi:transcriptional regulator with XRE-family HTH domain
MQAMERDPQYIAERLRAIRTTRGLTQENVANLANVSTRTIEKLEGGRTVNEQTLRSIARGLSLDVSIFDKSLHEALCAQYDEHEKKNVLVRTKPVCNERDFLSFFKQFGALHCSPLMAEGARAMQNASTVCDYLMELGDAWDLMPHSQRLMDANRLAEIVRRLGDRGVCLPHGQLSPADANER